MRGRAATSIQPQLWVDSPQTALAFYAAAFGATTVHLVGSGDDIVAQLAVGEAAFRIAPTAAELKRLSPAAIDGATSRTLLVVDDPDQILAQAVAAGATQTAVASDPFGHEWEIGTPLVAWPPRYHRRRHARTMASRTARGGCRKVTLTDTE